MMIIYFKVLMLVTYIISQKLIRYITVNNNFSIDFSFILFFKAGYILTLF